jgi:hypothetical protein
MSTDSTGGSSAQVPAPGTPEEASAAAGNHMQQLFAVQGQS